MLSSPASQLALKVIPRRRSHSENVPNRSTPSKSKDDSHSVYSLSNRPWRHMEISCEIRISAPNRDIQKIIAFSGIFDLSPDFQNGRQGQGFRPGHCRSFHTYPCKTLFATIRQKHM
ncbi:hypothetical protein AVEN_240493-1 [Araneus ventricosus]|uniref:Uncharacterized protein n=1 Tax=Araneus ventricosus TaxID=182803 RepID=A0A4Y2HLR8_ARAVE|nr:hypothetical protein AVEN_240493-1 [Araneus ventricosus]